MKKLKERFYGLLDSAPTEKKVDLPHSKVTVKLTTHDAAAQMKALLSDPRNKDEDYLYFNDDPEQGPDADFVKVGDINTGLAYRETYQKLIAPAPTTATGRVKVLCPVLFYMDGCVMGQFDSLPLEAMKFTLGIFNGKARDCGFRWKPIGYVTKFLKEKSAGEELIAKSSHVDAQSYVVVSDAEEEDDDGSAQVLPNVAYADAPDDFDIGLNVVEDDATEIDPNEGENTMEPEIEACNAQDLHTMMACFLESYKDLQDNGGFPWDQQYKGRLFLLQIIPFVIFIKGDTVEHDKQALWLPQLQRQGCQAAAVPVLLLPNGPN